MHCLSNTPKRNPTSCTTRSVIVTWRGEKGTRFRPGLIQAALANQCPPPKLEGGSHIDAYRSCCIWAIQRPPRALSKPSPAWQARQSNHKWDSHPSGQHPVFPRCPRAPMEPARDGGDGSGGDRRRAHRLPQGGAPPHAASAMHAPHPTKGDRTKHRRIAVAASTTKLYPFAHLGVPKGTKDKPPGRTGLNPTRHPQHFFENSHSK